MPTPTPTFKDTATKYMGEQHLRSLSPNTLTTYQRWLNNHINPFLGDKPVDKVTLADVWALHEHTNTAPTLRVDVTRLALRVLRYAHEQGLRADAPTFPKGTLYKISVPYNPDDYLTRGQKRLVEFRTALTDRLIFQLVDTTGATPAELLGLRRGDVATHKAGTIIRITRRRIEDDPPVYVNIPNRRPLLVPLPAMVARNLEDHLSTHKTDDPQASLLVRRGGVESLSRADLWETVLRARGVTQIPTITLDAYRFLPVAENTAWVGVLEEHRKLLGLSLSMLSDLSGVPLSRLGAVLSGRRLATAGEVVMVRGVLVLWGREYGVGGGRTRTG